MVYVVQVCWQLAAGSGRNEFRPDPAATPLLCVQWKTPDDGQRNCQKHVEFYSKNKFEKFGFIIRTLLTVVRFVNIGSGKVILSGQQLT